MSNKPSFKDHFLTNLLRVLPQHLLAKGMYKLARSTNPKLKDLLINTVVDRFQVNLYEAKEPDTEMYDSFNAFFTRELRDDARPIDDSSIVSPSDGKVSQFGKIEGDRLIQAKGHDFDLTALLAGDKAAAAKFVDGDFATIYLSPRDYHRVHMPCDAQLTSMTFVPGDLFSVSEQTTQIVPNLFARNERVICYFDTAFGPMALILVGAIFVGSMETVWSGEVTGPSDTPTRRLYRDQEKRVFAKGDEMGRFNMGSTVILLFPENRINWDQSTVHGKPVQMGEALAEVL